jgi:glycerate-2-kinase
MIVHVLFKTESTGPRLGDETTRHDRFDVLELWNAAVAAFRLNYLGKNTGQFKNLKDEHLNSRSQQVYYLLMRSDIQQKTRSTTKTFVQWIMLNFLVWLLMSDEAAVKKPA